MLDSSTYEVTRWDLSDGSRRVWPVQGLASVSVQAALNSMSPNSWTQTINVGWSNRASGEGATNLGTLTSGSPSLPDLNVSSAGYLVFELSATNATQVFLDLWATGKA